jgi:hypothetical protein
MKDTQENGALPSDGSSVQQPKIRPWEPPPPAPRDEVGEDAALGPPPQTRVATGAELTGEVATYLERAPGSLFAGRPAHIVAQWDGSENLLWRFEVEGFEGSAVLKLFPDAGLARGRRAVDAHERYADAGLAPRIFWYDRAPEGLPEPLIVYGWVEAPRSALEDSEALGLLADVAAQIHTGSVEGISRYGSQPLSLASWLELHRASVGAILPWLEAASPLLPAAFATVATQALAVAEAALPLWRDVPLCPVHGDLLPEHALRTPDGPSPLLLVDWEGFGLGDPAREVARLIRFLAAEDAQVAFRWLMRYLAQAPPPNLAERIDVYVSLLPFESLCRLLDSLRMAPPPLTADEREETAALLGMAHSLAEATLDDSYFEELLDDDEPDNEPDNEPDDDSDGTDADADPLTRAYEALLLRLHQP